MLERNKLQMSSEHATYFGNYGRTEWHTHGAPVLLIGLSGNITIGLDNKEIECRSALIDSNTPHIVDCHGEHVATTYFEVDTLACSVLRRQYLQDSHIAVDIASNKARLKRSHENILDGNMESILPWLSNASTHHLDKRILTALQVIKNDADGALSQEDVAKAACLSKSRLTHLFKQHSGVSYRRYRLWSQVSHFMRDVHLSKNITESALNTGFYDSSHLCNSYKKVFGINPHRILSDLHDFTIRV